MDIDDDVIDLKKPKLASVSVSPLRNQFDNVFCISNRKDSHESIDVNSYDSNIRKRQSSSSVVLRFPYYFLYTISILFNNHCFLL